jgi:hypothetical protein
MIQIFVLIIALNTTPPDAMPSGPSWMIRDDEFAHIMIAMPPYCDDAMRIVTTISELSRYRDDGFGSRHLLDGILYHGCSGAVRDAWRIIDPVFTVFDVKRAVLAELAGESSPPLAAPPIIWPALDENCDLDRVGDISHPDNIGVRLHFALTTFDFKTQRHWFFTTDLYRRFETILLHCPPQVQQRIFYADTMLSGEQTP